MKKNRISATENLLDESLEFNWSKEQKQKAMVKIIILMGFLLLVTSLRVIYAGCP